MVTPTPAEDGVPPRDDPRIGSKLAGKYRIDGRLGAGGMGVVYEATNTWTERRVAVKILEGGRNGRATLSPVAVDRFLLEAKVASRIEHPNVVSILDLGRDEDGTLFIVQELLAGPTLDAHLAAQGPLTVGEALDTLRPVMSGLVAAHAAGVVHRDVKPENIILARDSAGVITPKLLDFGVALATESTADARMTNAGQIVGTPAFMSPEQAMGARDIDDRSDVWAMGLVWVEALTGRRQFEGQNCNEVLAQVLTRPVGPLRTLCPTIAGAVADAIDGALCRDRDARHPSMAAFLASLDRGPGGTPAPHAATPRAATLRQARAMVAVLAALLLAGAIVARTRAASPRVSPRPAPTPVMPFVPAPPGVAPLVTPSPPTAPDAAPPLPPAPAARVPPAPPRTPARARGSSQPPINGAPILEL